MAKPGEVQLGQEVKDIVTGVQGIAVVLSDFWHGSSRIEIQPPKKKDGSVPDIHVADEAQIKVMNVKPSMEVPKFPPARFQYGEKVKDPVSGYTGTANGRALFLNGCVRVGVQAHKDDYIKGAVKVDGGTWFPEELLQPTGKWTVRPENDVVQPRKAAKPKTQAARPGGPAPRTTREPRAHL